MSTLVTVPNTFSGAPSGSVLALSSLDANFSSIATQINATWNGSAYSVSSGGTGITSAPSNGQLLIGNGTSYTLGTLTGGTGIGVTNGSGSINLINTGVTSIVAGTNIVISNSTGVVQISSTGGGGGGGGTVTSVGLSGGSTGLTVSSSTANPIVADGTFTLGGTLAVANGGTGVTTSTGSGNNVLSTSPTLVTPVLGTPTSVTLTNATGLPLSTGVTGVLFVSNGGSGASTLTGYIKGNGTSAFTASTTLPSSDVTYNEGGTGAVTRGADSRLQDFVSVMDFIPTTEIAAIRAFTSTTDLSSYINAAITSVNARGGTLFFPEGLYPIGSVIGATGLSDITFQGSGGKDLTYSGTKGTVIKFTGTGSGNILNLNDYMGVYVRDIQIAYVSNSFTGTMVNCASSFTTGNGCGFHNVQCYQITNSGRSASQCFYLKNNVDVVFDGVYCSHANYGWVGLLVGDTGETNMIKLINCTSIGLNTYGIYNPIYGWSLYSVNFEPGLPSTQPAGVYCHPSFTVKNFNMYGCVFADCTSSGTWINLPWVFSFSMFGGGVFSDGGTVIGIELGSVYASGATIQNVLFSGLTTALKLDAPSGGGTNVGIIVLSNNFLFVTTPFSGFANIDAGSIFMGNDPITANRFSLLPYTTTEKLAITSPNAGLTVFDTNLSKLSYYNGSGWTNV